MRKFMSWHFMPLFCLMRAHVMPFHANFSHVMSCHAGGFSCGLMSCQIHAKIHVSHVMPFHAVYSHVMSCEQRSFSCHVMSCCFVLMSCHVMSCAPLGNPLYFEKTTRVISKSVDFIYFSISTEHLKMLF